jgi:hypothetical protein
MRDDRLSGERSKELVKANTLAAAASDDNGHQMRR